MWTRRGVPGCASKKSGKFLESAGHFGSLAPIVGGWREHPPSRRFPRADIALPSAPGSSPGCERPTSIRRRPRSTREFRVFGSRAPWAPRGRRSRSGPSTGISRCSSPRARSARCWWPADPPATTRASIRTITSAAMSAEPSSTWTSRCRVRWAVDWRSTTGSPRVASTFRSTASARDVRPGQRRKRVARPPAEATRSTTLGRTRRQIHEPIHERIHEEEEREKKWLS